MKLQRDSEKDPSEDIKEVRDDNGYRPTKIR
jgi:hypothetical protein